MWTIAIASLAIRVKAGQIQLQNLANIRKSLMRQPDPFAIGDNQVKLLKRQSESGDGGGRGGGSPAARLVEVHQTRAQLEDEVKTLAARGTGNSPVSG